jgi:hypothetical protein
MIFRGSRDGFKASECHRLCDNQGPTITFIRTEFDKIIGGYTKVSWTSSVRGEYKVDDSAFLFSLTN